MSYHITPSCKTVVDVQCPVYADWSSLDIDVLARCIAVVHHPLATSPSMLDIVAVAITSVQLMWLNVIVDQIGSTRCFSCWPVVRLRMRLIDQSSSA